MWSSEADVKRPTDKAANRGYFNRFVERDTGFDLQLVKARTYPTSTQFTSCSSYLAVSWRPKALRVATLKVGLEVGALDAVDPRVSTPRVSTPHVSTPSRVALP